MTTGLVPLSISYSIPLPKTAKAAATQTDDSDTILQLMKELREAKARISKLEKVAALHDQNWAWTNDNWTRIYHWIEFTLWPMLPQGRA